MDDGLKEKYRTEILMIFASCPHVKRAVLFGSRAKGKSRRDSDIDFALEGNDLTSSDMGNLREQFEESDVPFDFDLLIRANITNPDLEKQIEKYGVEFYRKTEPS